jgi:hypothetical protein
MFQKLILLPFSGEGLELPILLGPLQKVDLNHWTTAVDPTITSYPSAEKGNRSSTQNIAIFYALEYHMMDKSKTQ